MQTPQCSLVSDGSTLQSLQKLRTALQQIPKWLQRQEIVEDEHLLGKVTGEANYKFTFKIEGGGYFQTGVLVANGANDAGLPIPLKCRWKRRVQESYFEIPGVTTNMYQISADDVGTMIMVEACPAETDEGAYGTVTGYIGPFELDPATRRCIDNALGVGSDSFVVAQQREEPFGSAQAPGTLSSASSQVAISIDDSGVHVTVPQGDRGRELQVSAEFSAEFPRVLIHPLDNSKFQLILSDTHSFNLLAPSRAFRDRVALTIRYFHAMRFVMGSVKGVLNDILPIRPLVAQAPRDGSERPATGERTDDRMETCIRLERLRDELNKAMMKKEVGERVLRNTKNEKKQLQEQLMESISGCTDVIVGLQDQFSEGASSSAPVVPLDRLKNQLRDALSQVEAAREELRLERQRLEDVKRHLQAAEELKPIVQGLREERDMLSSRLSDLSAVLLLPQQQDQAEQDHASELKRLRQDVESLHVEKERLRRTLQDKERKKQELQENFFYVKGQLEKWQVRVYDDGEGAAKELEKHNMALSNVREERTRFATKLESIMRDQEKEKVYHEQHLERVVATNARLMEERDRVAKEVQRLSKMYADSVRQLQASLSGAGADAFSAEAADAPDDPAAAVDPAEVASVRAELRRVVEAIRQKEAEADSLRVRIRKLAVDEPARGGAAAAAAGAPAAPSGG